ncbi:carbon starvation CstA family protein [Tepidibacillus fermentans]|uniref:Carbon starvation protein n=1 Tax=Tepidibacillus fermentans TaxID=1281767 RepID=A0A4R3KHW0_9BACI|nr:carbon starvation CstA family protein [Tepidibacillus fermentans]TCS83083.1 carbon starvation protein [Tepidibacillus fermentans]
MKKTFRLLIWAIVIALATYSLVVIAINRKEHINALWILTAALGSYFIAYRFYARFLAYKVFGLDNRRATAAEVHNDGKDFVPTNKYVLYGHHFAAIAGAGPLVGPTLAAQMGYLPGALWIIAGVIIAGAVQDFIVLFISMRRDGKSLGEIAKEEIGPFGGFIALIGVLSIMIILIAVLALVVVNALKGSPWGTFTIAMTIPIGLLLGFYMRYIRPGKVMEASIIGFALLIISLWGGKYVAVSPFWGPIFTLDGTSLAIWTIIYGFIASVLPVWMLLAPRDYLSTFLKIGTISALAIGIFLVLPDIQMPAFTKFINGTGPVFSGNLFPFLFITIACGAVSGFHALISSGTTPKLIAKEKQAQFIAFGGMLTESFVAIMALIAATILTPGVYFAINSPPAVIGTEFNQAAQTITSWGFPVTGEELSMLSKDVDEETILSRTGGAPSLAVGMAHIFTRLIGGKELMAFWYHFAILFEAVFILTTVDAGTRVARFMLQDLLSHIYKPLGRTDNTFASVFSSAIIVGVWGYFLYTGVTDPLGGINTLWPLFGISNQMLAAIALTVGTTVLFKMGKSRYTWTTIVPLSWLIVVTMSAGWQKIFSDNPKVGFLAHANFIRGFLEKGQLAPGVKNVNAMNQIIFNDRLDAAITGLFMIMVIAILADAIRVWYGVLSKTKEYPLRESEYIPSKLGEEGV